MTALAATGASGHDADGGAPRWNRSLVAGAALTGTVVALAVLAPVLSPHDPTQQDLLHGLEGPSSQHLLGTDQLGRDVLSRLLYAARLDLAVGLGAVVAPFVTGTVLGTAAGYLGGWVDRVVMRVVDVLIAFPFYLLVIALVFVVGPGVRGVFVALAIADWVVYARVVRSATLVVRESDYVRAARGAGLSTPRILLRHVLPNTVTQAVVYVASDVVLVLVAIITLGYLGLGVQPPTPDWGSMINEGQAFLTTHPWLSTVPGLAVVVTGLGLALLSDGLTEALRP